MISEKKKLRFFEMISLRTNFRVHRSLSKLNEISKLGPYDKDSPVYLEVGKQ